MDKIYTDPNVENDNTEHIRRKRLSSILKVPRNPLDDLGHGNEMTQDINTERRRRSSRRVSFANTIDCRVFQRDLKNSSSETENTVCSADEKDDILTNQSEDLGSVSCEITGMNTLLHAPIQALGQQMEWHDVDCATPRTDRQDTTVVFSEENEMEMTASHTAMIQRNLRSQQPDKPEKINFTSFLAKLHSSQAKAESSKELSLLSDPTSHPGLSLEQKEEATTAKKIDLGEFLLGLKPNKEGPNCAEGPDKENVCYVPSQGSGDVAQPSREFGYSCEPLDTCNETKVFRGQEGGMEMTKYEATDVQIPFPGISEAPPEQWECADVTKAFADEGMDVTTSHTAKVSFALSTVGNQNLNFQKDFSARGLDNSVLRRASNQDLNVQEDLQYCVDRKRANDEGRGDPPMLRAGKQEARTVSAIQGSISSEIVFRRDRTVAFSECDDMEMTENYQEKNSSCHKICERPGSTNPGLPGSRHSSCGDIPKGLAPGDNPAVVPYKISAHVRSSASGGHTENMPQARGAAAGSAGFGSCTHSAACGVLKSRFHPSANPQLAFSGEKTVIFTGEDMDVAKTWFVKDVGKSVDNEHPTAVFTSVTCKPHFLGDRSVSSNVTEQEEMEITRCHTVVFDGRSTGITAESKQTPCKIIPRKTQNRNVTEGAYSVDMDKENVEVRSIDGNMKRSQAMERNADGQNSERQEKPQPLRAVSKVLPTQRDSERHFSMGKKGYSREDLKTPPSAPGLLRRSVEEPVQARTSEPPNGRSHLSSFEEKSALFLHSENMDITGSCVVMVPDYSINVLLSQNNAAPGCFGQGGNEIMSLGKGAMATMTAEQDGQEAAAGGRRVSFALPQDMEMTTTHTAQHKQPIPSFSADKTIMFVHNQEDMDMTASHTVTVSNSIGGFEAPQVPHTNTEQPPQSMHSELVSSRGEADSSQCATKPNDSIPSSDSSASAFPREKVATKDPSGTTPQSVHSISLREKGAMATTKAEQDGQEATAGGRRVSFALPQDMEMTTTHTAQHKHPIPSFSADKTIMFVHNQEDMDITASHTVTVSKNIGGFEAQQMSHTNTEQPPQSMHSELVSSRVKADSSQCATKPNDSIPSSVSSASAFPREKAATKDPSGTAPQSVHLISLREKGAMTEQDGQEAAAGSRTVSFALPQDMEMTTTHTAQHRQPIPSFPADKTIMFVQNPEDMDITASHTVTVSKNICGFDAQQMPHTNTEQPPQSMHSELVSSRGEADSSQCATKPNNKPSIPSSDSSASAFPREKAATKDPSGTTPQSVPLISLREKGAMATMTAEQDGQEATAGGRRVSFALPQDMEMTTTHTAQHRQPIPSFPADKTIVFVQNPEDMDITASHTVTVSKNICGFEVQQMPHTNTKQPPQSMHSELVSSRVKADSSQCATKPNDSIPSSDSSASAFPREKAATKDPSGTAPQSVDSISLQENITDVGAPGDHGLPMDSSVPVGREQDLMSPEKLQSKGVSFKFPSKGPVDPSEESSSLGSCVPFPMKGSDPWKGRSYAPSTQRNQVEEDSSLHEESALGLAGANPIPAANKESKTNEKLSAEGEAPPKDFQVNSEQTEQPLVSDSSRDQAHPSLPPPISRILGICSKLKDLTNKSLSVSKAASDQLPSSSAQPEEALSLGKNTVSEANNLFDTKQQENKCLESEPASIGMAPKDKYPGINIPLGIFKPKLPNKRNPVSSVQDTNTKSDRAEAPVPANTSETPGNKSSRQNFSPSEFLAEEFFPVCLEDTDSNDSLISELVENAWDDKNKKQIPHSEKAFEEAKSHNTKRAFEQKEEDLQSPKKAKRDEHMDTGTCQDLEVTFDVVPQDQAGVGEGVESPNLSAKSPECPHASTSSSLDSVKADTELTLQRSSQVESQLLMDSICEENLWEKFQSGTITVGEFFTLLQVHIVIQKPRHSQLPASCEASAPPTAEDLIYSQYVHRPKLRIYEEDCQDLSQKTVDLKPHVSTLDQPLVHVNRSLWEVMRTCTDEELRNFGAELKKMKSCFTKEAKILSHNEKEILYRKLLQCAEEQCRKLQSRIEKVDDWMKEADSSMVTLESDSWHEEEASCSAGMAGGQNVRQEMGSITVQEEELLRELSEMDAEEERDLAEMEEHRKTIKACLDILNKYDFTEWELVDWSEHQAVFNFLYDSVMLTVVFGPPIDGELFASRPSRHIISLDFESCLDEEQAPPSSCLVLRLIFQFIESRGNWQEKCPTVCYLSRALFDISLVVNRCRILGDELEFLKRWGAKFHLLETDIKDTEVKLVFSSTAAFAKFDLTLALSHDYPSAVLPFSVHTRIGNIGEKQIAPVLSSVPVGHHYLRRIVASINHNLLLGPK